MLEQNQIAENCLMCGISISDIATEGVMCSGPIGQERLICKGCADGVVEQLRPKTSSASWGIEERVGHLERMVNILDARHSIISSLQDDAIVDRSAIRELQKNQASELADNEAIHALQQRVNALERLLHKQNQEMRKVENTCLWRHSSSQKA